MDAVQPPSLTWPSISSDALLRKVDSKANSRVRSTGQLPWRPFPGVDLIAPDGTLYNESPSQFNLPTNQTRRRLYPVCNQIDMNVEVSNTPNPYSPPFVEDDSWSWLNLVTNLFGTRRQIARRRFLNGYAIICEGISFYIDPNDATILYAASPSREHSDSCMNLIVSEVIRLAPRFAAEHGYMKSVLNGRKLRIRMIDSYRSNQSEFVREECVDLEMFD